MWWKNYLGRAGTLHPEDPLGGADLLIALGLTPLTDVLTSGTHYIAEPVETIQIRVLLKDISLWHV